MPKVLQRKLTELQYNKQNIQIKSEEVILRFIIFHKYKLASIAHHQTVNMVKFNYGVLHNNYLPNNME